MINKYYLTDCYAFVHQMHIAEEKINDCIDTMNYETIESLYHMVHNFQKQFEETACYLGGDYVDMFDTIKQELITKIDNLG